MEGALEVCRNCKRSVAAAHLNLHEAHCVLFLALCPECKEPVSQEQMDEHRKNGHQQIVKLRHPFQLSGYHKHFLNTGLVPQGD